MARKKCLRFSTPHKTHLTRPCLHFWLPPHSLHLHLTRPCEHMLPPTHCLQIVLCLLCSQIPPPSHSLHADPVLLCEHTLPPLHSLQRVLFGYAKVARWRALAAVVLDFFVRTKIHPLAFPKLCVSAWTHFHGRVSERACKPATSCRDDGILCRCIHGTEPSVCCEYSTNRLCISCTYDHEFHAHTTLLLCSLCSRGCKKRCRPRETLALDSSVQT